MTADLTFTKQEYDQRLGAVRERMAAQELDLCVISTPENIFYLTGLDHWGYFAPHLLLVPSEGEPVLVTRAMERATISSHVQNAWFEGHQDHETAVDVTIRLLHDRRFARGRASKAADVAREVIEDYDVDQHRRVGLEKWSSALPFGIAESLMDALPNTEWLDITDLVDALRLIKSPAEQRCIRDAAVVSDAAMLAAIDAIRAGGTEREIAAECHRAMIEAGGSSPGFGPFIRPTSRLAEEHTTWGESFLSAGEAVFLELSGCVKRYHAPMGRLVNVGSATKETYEMAAVCHEAFDAVIVALKPGTPAGEVYNAWQGVVDSAGLSHYRRHHCGYLVGIGFPPSWTGGNKVTGLRHDSTWEVKSGMTFHIHSWLMGTGRGDYFVSNTVLLGDKRAEVLTRTPMHVLVR